MGSIPGQGTKIPYAVGKTTTTTTTNKHIFSFKEEAFPEGAGLILRLGARVRGWSPSDSWGPGKWCVRRGRLAWNPLQSTPCPVGQFPHQKHGFLPGFSSKDKGERDAWRGESRLQCSQSLWSHPRLPLSPSFSYFLSNVRKKPRPECSLCTLRCPQMLLLRAATGRMTWLHLSSNGRKLLLSLV